MQLKIALVHDYLCNKGGSERVFQYLCQAFPEADIYTLAYRKKACFPLFETVNIRTTWLTTCIRSARSFRWFFPLSTRVMENLDFANYDLVISSSATTAKYIKVPKGIHICYCYMPTRALWHSDRYFDQSLKSKLYQIALKKLQKRDLKAAQQVDAFITISKAAQGYIQRYYGRDSEIIPCPIDCSQFSISSREKKGYLLVSRLEHWKRVDYAIEAFNRLKLPLTIIGTGSEEETLRKKGLPNITFLGEVDDAALAQWYAKSKAVIFTPDLEYGLIPLEANASGTPVIAFNSQGVQETMVVQQHLPPTAVLFEEQTAEALIRGVMQFKSMSFDQTYLRSHAEQFGVEAFKKNFLNKTLELYAQTSLDKK